MSRKDPKKRKQEILSAALEASEKHNYMEITKKDIAAIADISVGLINVYFGTMDKLRKEIMRAAVKRGHLRVVAQGIIRGDKYAQKIDPATKEQALRLFR